MVVDVDPPTWSGAAHTRNLASAALRMTYQLRVHGGHHAGRSGALLAVSREEGVLAAAILHAVMPRPLHVVANEAMMSALPEAVMSAAGDIPSSGPGAVLTQQRALAALVDERLVAVTGSLVPVGYLVAVSGVEVIPVVLRGASGKVPTDPPRPRSRIDVYIAPPVAIRVTGDPLRASTRAAVAEQVRQAVMDAENMATARQGDMR